MSTAYDDLPELSEFEIQMDNAYGEVIDIERQAKRCREALANSDPFRLMCELAEAQKIIRKAMEFVIAAQEEHIKPIREQAQRIT